MLRRIFLIRTDVGEIFADLERGGMFGAEDAGGAFERGAEEGFGFLWVTLAANDIPKILHCRNGVGMIGTEESLARTWQRSRIGQEPEIASRESEPHN